MNTNAPPDGWRTNPLPGWPAAHDARRTQAVPVSTTWRLTRALNRRLGRVLCRGVGSDLAFELLAKLSIGRWGGPRGRYLRTTMTNAENRPRHNSMTHSSRASCTEPPPTWQLDRNRQLPSGDGQRSNQHANDLVVPAAEIAPVPHRRKWTHYPPAPHEQLIHYIRAKLRKTSFCLEGRNLPQAVRHT